MDADQASEPLAPRIAVLFHRLGPYHHARLGAAARRASVIAVEFSEADATYAWDRVAGTSAFPHVTLFHDREIDDQSWIRVLVRMTRVLGALRPDVVALPGWSSRGALAALAWCQATGTPAIVMSASTRRDHVRHPVKEGLKRTLLRLCSGALAGGQAQADYLVDLGMPRARIRLGYDVVDNMHFATGAAAARADEEAVRTRLGLPPRYVLTSSRFIPKKNLHRLLQAFAQYRRAVGSEACSLVLVGDGPEAPALRQQIAEAGLASVVHMPGFKQYDDLPAYYGLAEAFVLASTSEQWGLVVNEAMAAGLPVLVSNHCGCAADLVEEGRNGFSFDPTDVPELARLLERVTGPTCDRTTMGEASSAIVARWSPEVFASGLVEAARIALGPSRTNRPVPLTPPVRQT